MIRANAANQLRDKGYLWPCCVIDIGRDMLSREDNKKVHCGSEYFLKASSLAVWGVLLGAGASVKHAQLTARKERTCPSEFAN